jgi:hypothetical protein
MEADCRPSKWHQAVLAEHSSYLDKELLGPRVALAQLVAMRGAKVFGPAMDPLLRVLELRLHIR